MASEPVNVTYEKPEPRNFSNNMLPVCRNAIDLFDRLLIARRVKITNKDHIFVYARKYIALVYKHLCSPHAVIYLSHKSLADVFEFYNCYYYSDGNPSLCANGRIKHRYLRSLWFHSHEAIRVVEADGSEFVDISRPERCAVSRFCRASLLLLRRLYYRILHHPTL